MVVNCKYEKLGNLYFICGLLFHTERFCKKKLEAGNVMISKEWGHWFRAQPRRVAEDPRASGYGMRVTASEDGEMEGRITN